MIDVSPAQLQMILDILEAHVPEYEVRAFGSRVTQTAKPYSDLDLVIVASSKLPFRELAALQTAFEESDLPYRVEVLDWQAISPEFKQVIDRGYEVIQLDKFVSIIERSRARDQQEGRLSAADTRQLFDEQP